MSTGRALKVADLAAGFLEAIVGHFAAAGVALPDRRGVVPGEPRGIAWDCEQLTITLAGIGVGPARDAPLPAGSVGPMAGVMSVRHAVLVATLVRCTPTQDRKGAPPTMAALETAGLAFMRDAGLLSQACVEFVTRLKASPAFAPEGKALCDPVEPVGPSGGYHALETSLAVTASRLE